MIVKAPASPRASEPGFFRRKTRWWSGKNLSRGFAQFFLGRPINCRGRLAPSTRQSFGAPLRQRGAPIFVAATDSLTYGVRPSARISGTLASERPFHPAAAPRIYQASMLREVLQRGGDGVNLRSPWLVSPSHWHEQELRRGYRSFRYYPAAVLGVHSQSPPALRQPSRGRQALLPVRSPLRRLSALPGVAFERGFAWVSP